MMRFSSCRFKAALLGLALLTPMPSPSQTLDPAGAGTTVAGVGAAHAERDGLILDGSFELGTCGSGTSAWTCSPFSVCEWILDLGEIGLTNYDGSHSAFLGGYCHGTATYNRRFCQDLPITAPTLSWRWLYFTYSEGNLVTVTIDDAPIASIYTDAEDHLMGWQQDTVDVAGFLGQEVELCFKYQRIAEEADSYFVDFVELLGETPTEALSFSAMKVLY